MHIRKVSNEADLKLFLDLPLRIYANDPNFVPTLHADLRKQLSAHGLKRQYVDFELFLALDAQGNAIGRIVPAINSRLNEKEERKVGIFGYFEALPIAGLEKKLLDTAMSWVKERGAVELRGPIDLTTHTRAMFLLPSSKSAKSAVGSSVASGMESSVGSRAADQADQAGPEDQADPADQRPFILMPYNPPRYCEKMIENGFTLAKKAYAYHLPILPLTDLFARSYAIAQKSNIRFRPVDLSRAGYMKDLRQVYQIFRQVFQDSWCSSWQSEEEFFESAAALRQLIDPAVFPVAELDGKMIGFFLTLPDYNSVLQKLKGRLGLVGLIKFVYYRRQIDRLRAISICVLPEFQRKMVAMALVHCLYQGSVGEGYRSAELSWIWEDNYVSRKITEAARATISREYGLYAKKVV